jgi:hypothetical protein
MSCILFTSYFGKGKLFRRADVFLPQGVPAASQRLIFAGRQLKDDDTFHSHEVQVKTLGSVCTVAMTLSQFHAFVFGRAERSRLSHDLNSARGRLWR